MSFKPEKVCSKIEKCLLCGKFKVFSHICNGKWCMFCKKEVDLSHKCYILTEKENFEMNENSVKTTKGFIFFDYEAMQTESNHEINLVCATRKCLNCINEQVCSDNDCSDYVFTNNQEFCIWLFNDKNKNFIALAHNMRSYDGYFIMNYIVSNVLPNEKLPEIVLNGSKILVIRFANITIKDSINFLPMGLAKLPKCFELTELKKGYFPHYFNTPENQNYRGTFPAPEFYGYKYMKIY